MLGRAPESKLFSALKILRDWRFPISDGMRPAILVLNMASDSVTKSRVDPSELCRE